MGTGSVRRVVELLFILRRWFRQKLAVLSEKHLLDTLSGRIRDETVIDGESPGVRLAEPVVPKGGSECLLSLAKTGINLALTPVPNKPRSLSRQVSGILVLAVIPYIAIYVLLLNRLTLYRTYRV